MKCLSVLIRWLSLNWPCHSKTISHLKPGLHLRRKAKINFIFCISMISAGTAAFITWPYVLYMTFKLRSPHFFLAVFSSLTSSIWSSSPSNSAVHWGRGDPGTRWGPSVQGGVSLSVQEVALAVISGKERPRPCLTCQRGGLGTRLNTTKAQPAH